MTYMLPSVTFDEPVVISLETLDEADEVLILEIIDQPYLQKLSAVLHFNTTPASTKVLVLYDQDEYIDLGDWSYQSVKDRVAHYYTNQLSFPSYYSPNAVDPTLGNATEDDVSAEEPVTPEDA